MVLNAVLDGFSGNACVVLRAVLLHPAAFVFAVLMVLQRYARPFMKQDGVVARHLRNPVVRTFGVGVIILQFFYAEYLKDVVNGHPLIFSLTLLVVESILQLAIDVLEFYTMERYRLTLHQLRVENRYQDLTLKLRRMLLYFWVQLALMSYLLYYINNDDTMHTRELASILKWLVALNLCQVTSDEEAGTRFHLSYWLCLLLTDIPEDDESKKDRICECIPIPFKLHWGMRMLMDYMINGLSRVVIMGIAPIYLADTDAMDFIKDSLALFFVTRLDDYDDIHSLGEKIRFLFKTKKTPPNKLKWLLKAIEADEGAHEDDPEVPRGNYRDGTYHPVGASERRKSPNKIAPLMSEASERRKSPNEAAPLVPEEEEPSS